jgi:hypothetical protein
LVFYYTDNGGIANVVLRRGLLGYKVVSYSGEVSPVSETAPAGLFSKSNVDGTSIHWYVLYDQSITRVVVGDEEAAIFSTDSLKMYYLLSGIMEPLPVEFYRDDDLIWTIE